jgi:peptidoglycan-associated lipoprotein
MRSLKLVILPLALMALIALVLGGCGGKKPPPEPPPPPPVVEPPTPEPVEPPPPLPPPPDPADVDAIYFEFDRYDLKDDARTQLLTNAKELERRSDVSVTIEGHCDERGTVEYNLALGEKRAKAAQDYLINYGIDASRISTVSYGEERPKDPGSNEDAWSKNRRDEFVTRE